MTNEQRIAAAVNRAAGKGLAAASLFLSARLKEVLNVPAPRKRVVSSGGDLYYRATTPARECEPPRKVSGVLQRSVRSQQLPDGSITIVISAKSPKGFNYGHYHEVVQPGHPGSGRHPFVVPTVKRYARELARIVGHAVMVGVKK